MKRLFLKIKKNDDSHSWIKCVLLQENELNIDNIASTFNQYIINRYPTKVFFESPNLFFYKKDATTYVNYSPESKILKMTVSNVKNYDKEVMFYGYAIMKNYLFQLLEGKEIKYDNP